jgi:pyruvyltransferase
MMLTEWALSEYGLRQEQWNGGPLLPIALVRQASILGERPTRRESVVEPRVDHLTNRDGALSLISRVASARLARITEDSSVLDVAIAALCRTPMEFHGHGGERFGFRLPEIAEAWADFNFDRAVELFTIDTITAIKLRGGSLLDIGRPFIVDGAIQLFISTRQPTKQISTPGASGNVGDYFGYQLLRRLTSLDVTPYGTWMDEHKPAVFTVGSIVQRVRDRGLVWGSGCIKPLTYKERPISTKSIFLGVRGPRTREQLIRRHAVNPRVIGDPGLLISEFMASNSTTEDIEVGFIIHSVDKEVFRNHYPDAFMIRNYKSLSEFIEDFARCKTIVSSGLHGLIFANAMGKPCVSIKLGDRITGGEFKYKDHAQSVGVYHRTVQADLCHAPRMDQADWSRLIQTAWQPARIPGRCTFLDTFPFPVR